MFTDVKNWCNRPGNKSTSGVPILSTLSDTRENVGAVGMQKNGGWKMKKIPHEVTTTSALCFDTSSSNSTSSNGQETCAIVVHHWNQRRLLKAGAVPTRLTDRFTSTVHAISKGDWPSFCNAGRNSSPICCMSLNSTVGLRSLEMCRLARFID